MKIGVICSGGDSPGMNAALLGIKQTIDANNDLEEVFFKNGYQGIFENKTLSINTNSIDMSKAGTAIGTARFEQMREVGTRKKVLENLKNQGVDTLIVIGGNGSLKGATLLKEESNINISVIAGTIDNDFPETDYTLGFDTALNTLIKATDELTATANSHNRMIIMEVMGRNCFALAENAAVATSTLWIKSSDKEYLHELCKMYQSPLYSPILLLPEGLANKQKTIEFLSKNLPLETKYMNMAYLQRGASPSYYDRYIGYSWGKLAITAIAENKFGILSQKNGKIVIIPW